MKYTTPIVLSVIIGVLLLPFFQILIAPLIYSETLINAEAAPTGTIDIWWPTNNVTLDKTQPFKALLRDWSVHDYYMFWYVDHGQWNIMENNFQDYPHKEASVYLSSWKWRNEGPYQIGIVAITKSGEKIAEKTVTIFVKHQQSPLPTAKPTPSVSRTPMVTSVKTPTPKSIASPIAPKATLSIATPVPTQTPTPLPSSAPTILPTTTPTSGNPFQGQKLFVDPNSASKRWADTHRNSQPVNAALMDKIANQAEAQWIGNWNANITEDVKNYVTKATNQGTLAVLIAYNIPKRDCGGHWALRERLL